MSTAAPHGAPADPFRLFFPLGIVLGVAGVSIWPAYFFGLTPGFSGRAHAFVQADGFMGTIAPDLPPRRRGRLWPYC